MQRAKTIMTRTAVEIEGLIKAAKDQKKLIKGNVGEEAKIAVALRELMAELNLVKPPAESNSAAFNLKVPKGTRDFNDNEMALRMKMFRHITNGKYPQLYFWHVGKYRSEFIL